jgi:hypothetical protein
VLFTPRAVKERMSARRVSLCPPLNRLRTEVSRKFVIVLVKDRIWFHLIVFCKWAILPPIFFNCCTGGRCSFALPCEGALCWQLPSAVSKIHTLCKTVMTYSLKAITVFIFVEASRTINHLFTRLWCGLPGKSFDSRHRHLFFSSLQRLGRLWGPPTDLSVGYPGLLCVTEAWV